MSHSQTLKKRRALKKTLMRSRVQTQRLRNLQRKAERSAKETRRNLEPGQLSQKERAFVSGLDKYREYYYIKKIKKVIDEAQKKLQKAKKDTFYVRVNGRPGKLEDIERYSSFDLLYLDRRPEKRYYVEFQEDEEENAYHQVSYFTRVYNKPPILFFIDWKKLSDVPWHIVDRILGPDEYYFGGEYNTPMMYLFVFPDFMEEYEKALNAKENRRGFARQKLERLQMAALEGTLERHRKNTGTSLPENTEHIIRSMMTRRPVYRIYNPTTALENLAAIQTNLFE